MIPLGDVSRRPTRFPIVTLVLIAVNVAAFCAELAFGDTFVVRWSLVPAQITSGHHLETILTAMFLHASWSHIVGNMVFFWAFGPEVEDEMGPGRYLLFYLLGGVVAMVSQVIAGPHSTVPNLGASGAIAAVMGAFLVTFPTDRIRSLLVIGIFVRIAYVPAMVLIGLWFLYQLWQAGTIVPTETGGVAYIAHIGGLLFGAFFARLFERSVSEVNVTSEEH
ncbi:MAG: rhomboid family intramembrane serine protease [Candidatus Eremiobacteraeota bacterium]|nr:rhomboid family intramembrane serine protease [Candidatus Eremiobacteraeota bacterium]